MTPVDFSTSKNNMSDKLDEKLSENEEEQDGQVRILLSDDDKPLKVEFKKVCLMCIVYKRCQRY